MSETPRRQDSYRVGHVHLKVASLSRSIAFYQSILPLEVTELVKDTYAFLSFGTAHHDLALQQVGEEAVRPESGAIGLFHVAFELPDRPALAAVYRAIRDRRIPVLTVDYGISWALYISDPDGIGVEIYVDMRDQEHGRKTWSGASRRLTAEQILGNEEKASR